MKSMYNEMTKSLNSTLLKYEDLLLVHTSDIKKVNEKVTAELEKFHEEYKQRCFQLEAESKFLQQREDELKKKECKILKDKKKLELKKRVRVRLACCKELLNECYSSRKQAENLKRELNMLHKRRNELEEQLKAESFEDLQSEVKELEIALQVIEDEDDMDLQEKLENLQSELKEKGEELEGLKDVNQGLKVMTWVVNDELKDARRALINGLERYPTSAHVVVKKVGELDLKPFSVGCYYNKKASKNGKKLASLWKDRLKDPNWHPFKGIWVGRDYKEILDEEDEKIVSLKADCSEEQYHAVVTALNELNECNPIGRYPEKELWNKNLKRKASLKEGIEYILEQWKIHKLQKSLHESDALTSPSAADEMSPRNVEAQEERRKSKRSRFDDFIWSWNFEEDAKQEG